ncbi:very short patch repair endonuclease [Thermodesulfobacteriota bacterium]
MDKLTKERRSWNMSRIKGKDTKPEKKVRSLLHKLGYRFRLNRKDLPGNPDIVLPRYHIAIFVHGCFWHQHKDCVDGHIPKSNTEYWKNKLDRNVTRDKQKLNELLKAGWNVIVIWECETKNEEGLLNKIKTLLY